MHVKRGKAGKKEKMPEEAKQKIRRLAREGQVFWGCNAAGELAPLPKEAIPGA